MKTWFAILGRAILCFFLTLGFMFLLNFIFNWNDNPWVVAGVLTFVEVARAVLHIVLRKKIKEKKEAKKEAKREAKRDSIKEIEN